MTTPLVRSCARRLRMPEWMGITSDCVGLLGVALITTGRQGENNIVVVPGANGRLTPQQLEKAIPLIEQAEFLLTQLEIPLETVEYLALSPHGSAFP